MPLIDKDLKSKNIKVSEIGEKPYLFSKQTYYDLLNIAKGKSDASGLRENNLKEVCSELGLEFRDIHIEVK